MAVQHRNRRWTWAGRILAVVILVGLAVYPLRVGLEAASKIGSVLTVLIAFAALVAPYLLPPSGGSAMHEEAQVEDSGNARAGAGGHANTGIETTGEGAPKRVSRSGGAVAEGPGSVANTGITHRSDDDA